jgi:hypothetical protein
VRRWNRYVELADSVTGEEGAEGVAAIISSLKAEEDYGAYQAAHATLARFPPSDLDKGVALAARDLASISEGWQRQRSLDSGAFWFRCRE